MASVFIGCAAVIDFLDGFVARLLKASSELGAQLDSLADVVSFGVAPGLIIYQFLRLCFRNRKTGLTLARCGCCPLLLFRAQVLTGWRGLILTPNSIMGLKVCPYLRQGY